MTYSLRPHYGPEAESVFNRKEYHEYFLDGKGGRCIGPITLPLDIAGTVCHLVIYMQSNKIR